jgi:hypothetical protein
MPGDIKSERWAAWAGIISYGISRSIDARLTIAAWKQRFAPADRRPDAFTIWIVVLNPPPLPTARCLQTAS